MASTLSVFVVLPILVLLDSKAEEKIFFSPYLLQGYPVTMT